MKSFMTIILSVLALLFAAHSMGLISIPLVMPKIDIHRMWGGIAVGSMILVCLPMLLLLKR